MREDTDRSVHVKIEIRMGPAFLGRLDVNESTVLAELMPTRNSDIDIHRGEPRSHSGDRPVNIYVYQLL